jgi:SAM-dependent methyltransferase
MTDPMFYGPDQALIHDRAFGDLARRAAAYLRPLLDEAGLRHGTVVDLGCGSGILASILTDAGYDVLGVDVSQDMIELASANAPKASFRHGSLLDVELPAAVAVTAIGEALNYATDPRASHAQLERLAASGTRGARSRRRLLVRRGHAGATRSGSDRPPISRPRRLDALHAGRRERRSRDARSAHHHLPQG